MFPRDCVSLRLVEFTWSFEPDHVPVSSEVTTQCHVFPLNPTAEVYHSIKVSDVRSITFEKRYPLVETGTQAASRRNWVINFEKVANRSTSRIMLTTSKVNSIRRKRDKLFEGTLTTVREGIDRYEQSNMQEIAYLRSYQSILQDGWNRFQSLQNELYEPEEDDFAQQREAFKLYLSLVNRIRELMEGKRPSTPSTHKCSIEPSNNVQTNDNNGHTPPTEITASTQMPISSHTTRSSPHDTRNVSTAGDLTTQTFHPINLNFYTVFFNIICNIAYNFCDILISWIFINVQIWFFSAKK